MGFRWATLHWEGGAFSFRRSAFLPDGSQRLPSPGTPQNKIELFSLSELYFNWHDRGRSSAHSPKAREAWELNGRKALEKPSKYLCGPHRWGSLIESRRLMAQCSHCKDETDRYDGGDVPVCVECSDRRKAGRPSSATEQHTHTHAALFHDFLGATARYHEAIGEFEAVMGQLRSGSPDLQRRLWRSVLRRRCSPNGVFGLKAFPQQLEQLRRRNLPLLEEVFATILPQGRPRRIIYLRRRDRLAQTASYARASLSGIWRKEQESADAPRIEYSKEALEAAERGIAFQEAAWEQMFAELRIEPLLVWHEDVLADSAGAAEAVANYLEVLVQPQATVDVPPIEKQSEGNSREWVERYGRSLETRPTPNPDAD